jgi:hypothetical protein
MDEQEPHGPRWWEQMPVWIVAVTQAVDVVARIIGF